MSEEITKIKMSNKDAEILSIVMHTKSLVIAFEGADSGGNLNILTPDERREYRKLYDSLVNFSNKLLLTYIEVS